MGTRRRVIFPTFDTSHLFIVAVSPSNIAEPLERLPPSGYDTYTYSQSVRNTRIRACKSLVRSQSLTSRVLLAAPSSNEPAFEYWILRSVSTCILPRYIHFSAIFGTGCCERGVLPVTDVEIFRHIPPT